MASTYRILSVTRTVLQADPRLLTILGKLPLKKSPLLLQQISTANASKCFSQDAASSEVNYTSDVEVSFADFHHVERLLPVETVPEVKEHSSYPTPSGWVPPNEEIRSKQAYLVRRTKNHMLPVYQKEKEVWGKMRHHVHIGKIEGDIWKLEAELRTYLQNKMQIKKILTQVHEVSQCIRIRGQHADLIAEFLLERGM